MKTLRARFVSFRDLLATAWPIVLVSAAGFYVAYQFVEPAPPRTVTMSTGPETGAYHAFARRYATLLASKGITLDIRTSEGAQENLQRLVRGEADVAFLPSGLSAESLGDTRDLRSLGSVAYEPVWVFYRQNHRLDRLHQLDGQRLAIGAVGSGVRELALQLLEANEISPTSRNLLPTEGLLAAEDLQQERIDAAFTIAAQESAVVQVLLRSPGVRVMSFSQADAYALRFPFLSKVVLPRAAVDLVRDTPPRDTVLLATTANVIARERLHPALASLLLQAMREVNGKAGFFQREGEFPSYKDETFVLSAEAERYFKSGPPLLQRYLPFWLAVLVERLMVLVLPVVLLFFPLLKLAPSIYSWRVRARIFRSYGDLKFLENELRQTYDPSRFPEYLARLDRIEDEAYARNVPLAFSDLYYTLREHIGFVRRKLMHLHANPASERPS